MSFDLKVHHRDSKTGKISKETPYTMVVSQERGTMFKRNGVEYHPDGSLKNPPKAHIAEPKPMPKVEAPVEAASAAMDPTMPEVIDPTSDDAPLVPVVDPAPKNKGRAKAQQVAQ